MRERIWPLLLFVVFLAILFYTSFQATHFYLLSDIWVAHEKSIATKAGGVGILDRDIVLRTKFQNPDFDDNACVFDLRAGPYLIQGPDTSEYWSLTIFNRRGEAMFTAAGGDKSAAGPYLIYAENFPTPSEAGGKTVVEVPKAQGIVVFRLLANRSGRAPLSDLQDALRCEPYRPAS